jgi:hypothetical protein
LFCALPTEARDRPVVRAAIDIAAQMRVRVAENARRPLAGRFGVHVGKNRRVGDVFDESAAKSGRWNSENDVPVSALARKRVSSGRKSRLRNVATRGVAAARDDEEVVHAAVVGSVGILFEPRLPDGAILRDEPGDRVPGPVEHGHGDRGIHGRASSAGGGLRVASETGVGIEARAQPVVSSSGDDLHIGKPLEAVVEKLQFILR